MWLAAALWIAQPGVTGFVPIGSGAVTGYMACAQSTSLLAQVRPTADGIVAELDTPHPAMQDTMGPNVPVALGPEFHIRGHWSTLEDDTGWLIALDRGEFGGGLWSLARGDTEPRLLLQAAVLALGRSVYGTYVVTPAGLDNGGGIVEALRLLRKDSGDWQVVRAITFTGELLATRDNKADGLFLLTTAQVLQWRGSQLEVVATVDDIPLNLFPFSLAVDRDHVYVGMHLFVLTIGRSAQDRQWLVPSRCRTFVIERERITMAGESADVPTCHCTGR